MVTLKRYLDGVWGADRAPGVPHRDSQPWPEFATALVDSISRHVLDGEHYGDIREDLRLLSDAIRRSSEPPDPTESIEPPMRAFRRRSEETAKAQCTEIQRMLATMNEALLMLASGSDRTVTVLKDMESTLQSATKFNDIASLKSKLHEVVRVIGREVAREREESARAISDLQKQLLAARTTFSSMSSEFGVREHAIAAFAQTRERAEQAIAAVFVLQRIRAIVVRYGKEAATELLHHLIRDRIQPLAPDAPAFLWSDEAAVLFIAGSADVAQLTDKIRAAVEAPFEHRLVAGGRVATLNASVRSVVLRIHQPPETVAADIDRFAGGAQ